MYFGTLKKIQVLYLSDYQHGTGHGVGSYLNVHEGPSSISFKHSPDDPGLRENMFLSNGNFQFQQIKDLLPTHFFFFAYLEPGYYEEGQFGIRLENIIRVVPANTKYNFFKRGYLKFEDCTFVPIQQGSIFLKTSIAILIPIELTSKA